jgi:hypothetical protein
MDLKDVKESHPVLLAEYAVANKLVSELAFNWWVPYTLKKRDRIIKAMKKRYFRKLEKLVLSYLRTCNAPWRLIGKPELGIGRMPSEKRLERCFQPWRCWTEGTLPPSAPP